MSDTLKATLDPASDWLKVVYRPEPYDCIDVSMGFAGPGEPVSIGLGIAEARELVEALNAAIASAETPPPSQPSEEKEVEPERKQYACHRHVWLSFEPCPRCASSKAPKSPPSALKESEVEPKPVNTCWQCDVGTIGPKFCGWKCYEAWSRVHGDEVPSKRPVKKAGPK